MNRQRVIFWLALMILGLETGAVPVAANMGVGEAIAGLSTSSLWELNRDAGGTLYISDYQLPAVVVVNPTSGAFTRYISPLTAAFVVTPSDAKPDTNGLIWWSDYYSAFGRINPTTNQITYWNLSTLSLSPGGLTFDAWGRVWLTQPYDPRLLRFNPANNELCRFSVGGGGNYVITYGGRLWVGDSQARRILRFDPATNSLTWWNLPGTNTSPKGLAFDADGRLWWADAAPGAGKLGRLSPESNQAVTYALPAGALPVAVVAGVEVMWYTSLAGTVGFVDPARASGSNWTLTTGSTTVSPTCSTVTAGTQTATRTTGTFSFPTVTWTVVSGTPTGITAYVPPGSTPAPAPYGMAFSDGRIWVTDQDRLRLARLPQVPQPPTLSIALSGSNLTLSWPPVTQDEGGGGVTVSSYQIWRSGQPYFRPWDTGVAYLGAPAAGPFNAGGVPAGSQAVFFAARSVADSRLISRTSSRVGAFSYTLTPGTTP